MRKTDGSWFAGAPINPFCPRSRKRAATSSTTSTATKKKARPPFPTATGADLPPVKKTVDARRCWMFSGPGKSYHTDVEEAKKLGFPNIVVQGMMATCFVAQVMLDHFGMGFAEGRQDVPQAHQRALGRRET